MVESQRQESSLLAAEPPPQRGALTGNGDDGDGDQKMEDAQNPRTQTRSDSDSDSDSEDEAQLNLQIQALETQLSNDPSNYDAYVQYIRALRKQGDVEKLRQSREAMGALFPLTPEMWREWTRDETTISSRSEDLHVIENLYERGVLDYLSVDLWCDYINFLQDHDPSVGECSPNGISKARNIFERAVTSGGLHFSEGSRIYEAYREFEQAIFITLGEDDTESKEKQLQRIRSLFFRQLSVPLADLRSTLLNYKAWEAEQGSNLEIEPGTLDGLPSHIASAYRKASEMLDARVHFENQIARKDTPDSERLQHFMTYLNYEKSFGDPARVQILFERAITELPICTELWLDYTAYLDKTIKTSSHVKEVYSRAVRNCPWVGKLWTRYLLHLERIHASEEEVSSVFEKSLLCTFPSYDEYLDLFLTRVDGLRRRISLSNEIGDKFDSYQIRDVFQRASDYLSPHLKNTSSFVKMYSYWARLELNLAKDLSASRGVWESLLKMSGSTSEAWQEYIAVEIGTGHINEARSLYKRCYSKRFPGTGSEDVCHSWVQFEREYGSLEDYDFAVQKVTPRLEELQLFRSQHESRNTDSSKQKENTTRKISGEKRKLPNTTDGQSRAKRQKDTSQNLNMSSERDTVQSSDRGEKGRLQGFDVQAGKPEVTDKRGTSNLSPRKPKHYNDQCTAFVSNLNLKATDKDLRAFFSDVGGVVAIRLLKDKFTGNSRGLAYVDFSDDKHLDAAVAKNKQSILGKRVSIARSDPQQRRKKGTVEHNNASKGRGANSQNRKAQQSDSKESGSYSKENSGSQPEATDQKNRAMSVELKGRNTFAMPRSVRPLGWAAETQPGEPKEAGEEKPKSNDEFRKMFMKS